MSPTRATLAIGGPTGTGKTALAVELARRLGGELVNADSRQVAVRLRVGTATPTEAELGGVRCHLLDLCEPGDPFSVADWTRLARACLDDLDARGVPAILVGGTGQYLRALRDGWDLRGRAPDPRLRAELTAIAAAPGGLARLAGELHGWDPRGAAALDLENPRRVVRAVEYRRGGAASLAEARARRDGRPLELVVLDADRTLHREVLVARVDRMLGDGALTAEVAAELARGTDPDALRRAGIGYAEALDVLEGRIDIETAGAATLRRTQRYVKAQRTWFRNETAGLRLERDRDHTTAALADAVMAGTRGAVTPPAARP